MYRFKYGIKVNRALRQIEHKGPCHIGVSMLRTASGMHSLSCSGEQLGRLQKSLFGQSFLQGHASFVHVPRREVHLRKHKLLVRTVLGKTLNPNPKP